MGGNEMIKGFEVYQLIQFYYTVAVTLYVIPKYLYLLKKKTLVIVPILLFCSSILSGIIIFTDVLEIYIRKNFYDEMNGSLRGVLIAFSICFILYNLCYWIMSTLYIDVKEEYITVHSVFLPELE